MSAGSGESTWTFFYTLDRQAIGDLFEPGPNAGPAGINLRVYDPQGDRWLLAWTTPTLGRYDQFEARADGDNLVMRGHIEAKGPFPTHEAKITFFDIDPQRFEWQYEAAANGTDGPWQLQARMHCRSKS